MTKSEKEKEPELSGLLSGTLNILGFKLDLGELLSSPEELKGGLEALREKLKKAGGKEVLSDEDWRQGGASITGHIQTHGILGEQEFHVGTLGRSQRRKAGAPAPAAPEVEVTEPPVDIFDEGQEVTIVADVPGISLEELDLKVEGSLVSLSSKATARRSYRKEIRLGAELEPSSLRATCRNGVLEVRVQKLGHG